MKDRDSLKTLYVSNRAEWREWLEAHFEVESEVWLVFPNKSAAKPSLLYNDAVEEALCFGWIDSTVKSLDSEHKIQWFLPRKNKSYYSQANKERLRWLWERDLIHPKVKPEVEAAVCEEFFFLGISLPDCSRIARFGRTISGFPIPISGFGLATSKPHETDQTNLRSGFRILSAKQGMAS